MHASDFTAPKGPVNKAFFPSDSPSDLLARITGYITQGTALAGTLDGAVREAAVRHYVLWRAYDAAHDLLVLRPAKLGFQGKGSSEYMQGQINAMYEKALYYKSLWDGALGATPSSTSAPATTTTRNRYTF